jgi:hypothetical protein
VRLVTIRVVAAFVGAVFVVAPSPVPAESTSPVVYGCKDVGLPHVSSVVIPAGEQCTVTRSISAKVAIPSTMPDGTHGYCTDFKVDYKATNSGTVVTVLYHGNKDNRLIFPAGAVVYSGVFCLAPGSNPPTVSTNGGATAPIKIEEIHRVSTDEIPIIVAPGQRYPVEHSLTAAVTMPSTMPNNINGYCTTFKADDSVGPKDVITRQYGANDDKVRTYPAGTILYSGVFCVDPNSHPPQVNTNGGAAAPMFLWRRSAQ